MGQQKDREYAQNLMRMELPSPKHGVSLVILIDMSGFPCTRSEQKIQAVQWSRKMHFSSCCVLGFGSLQLLAIGSIQTHMILLDVSFCHAGFAQAKRLSQESAHSIPKPSRIPAPPSEMRG